MKLIVKIDLLFIDSRTCPKIASVNLLRVLSLRHPAVLITCGRQGTRLRATRTKILTRNFGISSNTFGEYLRFAQIVLGQRTAAEVLEFEYRF